MRERFWFDAEKTLEVLLYVAQDTTDLYKILKILYIADKEHLSRYGRLIAGDRYFAPDYGPVGSGAYDILKYARGEGLTSFGLPIEDALEMPDKSTVTPCRRPDMDLLSKSDILCLDTAIEKCKNMTFGELKELTHDDAYKATPLNAGIQLERIVQVLPNGWQLQEHFADE